MRPFLFVIALALVAAPLQAQHHDRYKITAEELAQFGDQSLADALPRARPQFFDIHAMSNASMAQEGVSGQSSTLIVYIGNHAMGDSTTLRYYRTGDVKEVRFYKPDEAMARVGANNAYVIQVIMKDAVRP